MPIITTPQLLLQMSDQVKALRAQINKFLDIGMYDTVIN